MYYTVLSTTSAAFYFCCVEFSILFTVGIVLLKLSIIENCSQVETLGTETDF